MAASLVDLRIYGKKEAPPAPLPKERPLLINLPKPALNTNYANLTIQSPIRILTITGGLSTDATAGQRKLFVTYQDQDGNSIAEHTWGGTCPPSSSIDCFFGIGMPYAFTNGTSEVAATGNTDTAPLMDIPMYKNYKVVFGSQNLGANDQYGVGTLWYVNL